jgi:hypothetical protein
VEGPYVYNSKSIKVNLSPLQGLGIFLYRTAFRPAVWPTQPPIQWVSGALSLGVKRPENEADHSPQPNAEVKNAWRYTSTPPIRLQRHIYLIFVPVFNYHTV